MNKKKFDINQWTPMQTTASAKTSISPKSPNSSNNSLEEEVNLIIVKIESLSIDIASTYADWCNLGFALADALGEQGRDYFHRLSRFYPRYDTAETDKQFDNCLKAKGHGVSIKTFFFLAQQAGIDIATIPKSRITSPLPHNEDNGELEDLEEIQVVNLPTFPTEIYNELPSLLQKVTDKAISPEDRDILLLGSLVTMSACLSNIYGVYAERTVYANLFLFVTAQASAGKGRLTLCRKLVEPIHKALRQQAKDLQEQYQMQIAEYGALKGEDRVGAEKPQEPPLKMLIIPANSSSTGLFQLLNENDGKGLLFETEGDTLAQTFKSEHGNYSDGFRKAFHHEPISYNRRKDREFVEIETPRLSALLSGTPKQVASLIPNAENGLFSRFIFYHMNIRPVWNDVFAGDDNQTLDEYFDKLGREFFELHNILQTNPSPIRFSFTVAQQKAFNEYFAQTQNQYCHLYGLDYIGTVRRLGLITFRLAMILSTLRILDHGLISNTIYCTDGDFNNVLNMVKVLVQHAAHVYQQLPAEHKTKTNMNLKQQFFDLLPAEFNRQTYLVVAKKLNIPAKTAEKQIKHFVVNGLLNHFSHDCYRKL